MLMVGEIDMGHQLATNYLLSDPMVDLTLIPAGDVADVQTSKRFVRIYIPRTQEKLVNNFDVLELFDFVPYVLMDQHIVWMHDAIKDHGLGLALVEMGWYPVDDWTGNAASAWMATALYDAYPADLVGEGGDDEGQPAWDSEGQTGVNGLHEVADREGGCHRRGHLRAGDDADHPHGLGQRALPNGGELGLLR
jgi:hypothetical protein